MKRYDFIVDEYGVDLGMCETAEGDWLKFKDVSTLLEEVDSLLDAVNQAKPHVIKSMQMLDDSWIWDQIAKLRELRANK